MLTMILKGVRLQDQEDKMKVLNVDNMMVFGMNAKNVSNLKDYGAVSFEANIDDERKVWFGLGIKEDDDDYYVSRNPDIEHHFFVAERHLDASREVFRYLQAWQEFQVFLTTGDTSHSIVKWLQRWCGTTVPVTDLRKDKSTDLNGVILN